MNDMVLLREYAHGQSESAFAALVSRHVNLVYSAALRQVRDPHLAGEITQVVFIILAQKAGRISDKTNLTGWLFKTTRFTALAQMRAAAKRSLRRATIEKEFQMQNEFQPATLDETWNQMSPLLDEALAKLGEKDRQAVLLRFFENKSLAEVGSNLGTGEDTARKRVTRALEKLRKFFGKRGVVSTTAIIAGAISANSVQAAPAVLAGTVVAVAAAKGAAAGVSTLTLIKGALKIMAWTKVKITVITVVSVLLVGGTATLSVKVFRERGADYNGKPVNYWVDQALWGMNPGNSQETYEALKHIGAPAAALLVQALTQTNSAPKDPNFLASYVRQNAFAALEQMGPSAKSQVPELIGLLKHDDKNVRIWATLVLADMGPAAKAAVPALKEESQDTNYAAYAKEALRRIGP